VLAHDEVLHEIRKASGGLEGGPRAVALVEQLDLHAASEERELLEALGEHLVFEVHLLEDLRVRPESDRGTGALRRLALAELGGGLAARELLQPVGAVALHVDLELRGQRVHNRHADAVEAAGDAVAAAAEL